MGGQMADTDATIREMIDKAIGVLMTLRGCSERAAFDELVVALQDIGVDPFERRGPDRSSGTSGTPMGNREADDPEQEPHTPSKDST